MQPLQLKSVAEQAFSSIEVIGNQTAFTAGKHDLIWIDFLHMQGSR
jgi:hypothetical protein